MKRRREVEERSARDQLARATSSTFLFRVLGAWRTLPNMRDRVHFRNAVCTEAHFSRGTLKSLQDGPPQPFTADKECEWFWPP